MGSTRSVDSQPSPIPQEIETHRKPDLKKVPACIVERTIERDRTDGCCSSFLINIFIIVSIHLEEPTDPQCIA